MKWEFEKKLKEIGFSFQCHTGLYILSPNNNDSRTINIQLIYSEPVDPLKYGSNNGIEIESIGLYKFKLNPSESQSDFIAFALRNSKKERIEFVIIPTDELNQRLTKEYRTTNGTHKHKIVFWLMPDNCLYDCTNLGIEGEWFYMSKGQNGRLADQTEWNYTEYLNRSDRLKRI
jgi:hypothetical protein